MAWELIVLTMGMAAVAAGCLVPAAWLPRLPNDKLLHFLAYATLTLLAGRLAQGWAGLAAWLLVLLVAGWAIELLQNLVPGRRFCWRDMAANAAGIALAAPCAPLVWAQWAHWAPLAPGAGGAP